MPENHVENDEEVYRRVPSGIGMYSVVDGKLRFSSTAFNDPGRKPSVDRAKLRDHPSETKIAATDGVVSLITIDIRTLRIEDTNAPADEAPKYYYVDVVPRPVLLDNPEGLPENMAHAQVESDPVMASPSRFKKLKEALAILASNRDWLIEPS